MRHCVLGTYNSPSYPSPMSFTHLAKERAFSGRFNYPVAIFESQHLSSCKPAIHQPCNELVINLYLYCRTNIALSWMAEWQRQTSCALTDCLPHRMATSGSHPPCMTNLEKFHIRRGVEKKKTERWSETCEGTRCSTSSIAVFNLTIWPPLLPPSW